MIGWFVAWCVLVVLQGARLSVALVSSSSIRALIMGVREQDSLRPASHCPPLCSWCLGWGRDCSHSGGDAHLQKEISVNDDKNDKWSTTIKKKTHLQLPPAGDVSTELPAPDDWSVIGDCDFLWTLDWLVWRKGDFLPPFSWSEGGQGDFLRVTSGSALRLLGDSSRSGWWKRLWTCSEQIYMKASVRFLIYC